MSAHELVLPWPDRALHPNARGHWSKRAKAAKAARANGCLIAGTPGTPPELHHPRTGAGAGQKAPDSDVIPLCPPHHRGTMHPVVPSIHLDRVRFIETFGSEMELLHKVQLILKGAK